LALWLPVRAAARCPDAADIPIGLGLGQDEAWHSACLEHPKGFTVLGVVRVDTGPTLRVVLAVVGNGKPSQVARVSVEQPDVRAVLARANDAFPLELRLLAEDLGGPAVRVSVGSTTGEDFMMVQEIAVLFQLRPEGPVQLWTGLGARAENTFGICFYDSQAEFELVTPTRLRRTVVSHRVILKAYVDEQVARDVRKGCVRRPRRTDTFSLEPR
jgi:hypothetical protein